MADSHSMVSLTVVLSGDGPWGFRLGGGTYAGEPLIVAKVRAKSKAEGHLLEGDVLISVNGWPCHNLSYDEVVDILDAAETELELQVARSADREYIAPPKQESTRTVDRVAMETEYRAATNDVTSKPVETKLPNADSMNELELPLAQVQKQLDDLLDNIDRASAGRQSTEPFGDEEYETAECYQEQPIVTHHERVEKITAESQEPEPEPEVAACNRFSITKTIEPIQMITPVRIDDAAPEVGVQDGGASQQPQDAAPFGAQPPVTTATNLSSFLTRDDVTRSVESETTPEGYIHRTVTREVTSEPNKMAEVVTATAEERRGDAEIRSVLHEAASVQQFRTSQPTGFAPANFAAPTQAPSAVKKPMGPPVSQTTVPTFAPAAASEGQMFHVSKFVSKSESSTSSTSQPPPPSWGASILEDRQLGCSIVGGGKDAIQSSQSFSSQSSSSHQMFSSSSQSSQSVVSQSSSKVVSSQSSTTHQQQIQQQQQVQQVQQQQLQHQTSVSSSSQQVSSSSTSVPAPPPMQNKQRPSSMPPLDFNILEAIESNKISLVGGQKEAPKPSQSGKPSHAGKSASATKTTKEGHTINTVSEEDSRRFQMLMKAFQPPPEDEGLSTPERKKKMFSSSSFYDEPTHRYPTMEEQVKLCKKIADSLSAEPNLASRGATMYIKRKKRSFNWITEGPDPTSSESETYGDYDSDVAQQRSQSYSEGDRPKLKLVLDPRQVQDAMQLAKTGVYNEHNVVSPDICFNLVRDLNSPTGKGAQLFAKRKKKSESWVVDENSVKEALSKQPQLPDVAPLPTSDYRFQQQTTQQQYQYHQQQAVYVPPPINKLQEIQDRLHPKVKLVKSPWEAALESPYGSCDAAFELIQKKSKAAPLMPLSESLLQASEWMEALPPLQPPVNTTYVPPPLPTTDMRVFSPRPYSPQQNVGPLATAPPPKAPQRAPQQQQAPPQPPPRTASPFGRNLYSANAPKGWTGSSSDQFQPAQQWQQEPALQFSDFDQFTTVPEPRGESPSFNKYSLDQFGNYNNTAKAWTGGYSRPAAQAGYRPVRPMSMYVK